MYNLYTLPIFLTKQVIGSVCICDGGSKVFGDLERLFELLYSNKNLCYQFAFPSLTTRWYVYLHGRHSNLGHQAMGQVVFLPRPEIIYINTPFSLPRPEVIYMYMGLVDFSPKWRQWK